MTQSGFAAKKKEPRLLEFAGNYTGSVVLAGQASGSTTARITASKKKDAGSISLNSTVILSGGTAAVVAENFSINKRALSYSIVLGPTAGAGSGTVAVGKKIITYTANFSITGTAYTVNGTISKVGKRGLTINETISSPGTPTTLNFIYNLTRQGKK